MCIRIFNLLNIYQIFNFEELQETEKIDSIEPIKRNLEPLMPSEISNKESHQDSTSNTEKTDRNISVVINDISSTNIKGKFNILTNNFINSISEGYNNYASRINKTYNKYKDIMLFGTERSKILEYYMEYKNKKLIKKETEPNLRHVNSNKLLNSALCIISLDLLFLVFIIFSLCSMIELYKLKNGFVYVFQIVIIAYQCDNGALLFGKLFGKHQFGFPITPTKTREGILGAFVLGY